MEDSRIPKRVMREKIYTRRKRGRPKVRWLADVQEDLREMGIEGWRRKAQDRDQWRRIAQRGQGSRRAVAPSGDDITTRLLGRTKSRWDDTVKQDICKMKTKNWTVCVQDRGKWRDVEETKTFNI
jgi:hypothetical protein